MCVTQRLRSLAGSSLAALLGIALLAGCGGSTVQQPVKAPSPGVGVRQPTDAPGARIGPSDPTRVIPISVSLATTSDADLDRALATFNDPKSPDYHRYLTPDQFAAKYGARPEARFAVERVLRASGLTISANATPGQFVGASGMLGQIAKLFGVRIDDYRTADGQTYYATSDTPRLPDAWKGIVVSVLGLNNRPALHPAGLRRLTASAANQPPRMLGPTELERAYNIAPLHIAGVHGEGQTIALPEIDTFKQSDIDAFDTYYHLSTPAVEIVRVNGGAARAKQVSETTLDIEVIHAVAPQAKIIVYEGPADFNSLADNFNRIVSDNKAKVMSVSLGGCEPAIFQASDLGRNYFVTLNNIFRQAASQGMTVFISSGDSGAYTCQTNDPNDTTRSASIPATNPFVTAVGGTALFVNEDGTYAREAGWESPLSGSGGGGGYSVAYSRPDWQVGPGVSNQYQKESDTRQIPDVSAAADPLTGYRIYDSTAGDCQGEQCWGPVGGTSASSPLWASIVTLINQQAISQGKPTMGFINPMLYKIGADPTLNKAFHDVTAGGNLYYLAAPGWDYSTGWGSPDAATFAKEMLALR